MDTNIVSRIVRQDRSVTEQFDLVATPENRILGCPVVWYEVRRGLLVNDSRQQMRHFLTLFATFEWQDYIRADWALAADLWVKRRILGLPIGDADLLIAVFTLTRQAVLVTNNEKDFAALGISVENWMKDNSS